jgi:hypothetical protein
MGSFVQHAARFMHSHMTMGAPSKPDPDVCFLTGFHVNSMLLRQKVVFRNEATKKKKMNMLMSLSQLIQNVS